MSTAPAASTDFEPELVLLLCGDPADAVTRALLDHRVQRELGWPLAAVSAAQMMDSLTLGDPWSFDGRRVDPLRSAVINRLPMADRIAPGDAGAAGDAGIAARQGVWSRLRRDLERFGYASSLPTASSIMGCHGSLLDQWQDLPRLVPGLLVPAHSTTALPVQLTGAVFSVDRWALYSLGKPLAAALSTGLPDSARLDYVRPEGQLVHLAQVGPSMFFPNAPPTMTARQEQAILDVARELAAVSPIRVLEHAFFLGVGPPVFYSTCPVPVLSGAHPLYPELVKQGLRNDIPKWRGRHRA